MPQMVPTNARSLYLIAKEVHEFCTMMFLRLLLKNMQHQMMIIN